MPIADRAAQFAPFAALTGYKEAIEETERLAEKKNRAGIRVKAKNGRKNMVNLLTFKRLEGI